MKNILIFGAGSIGNHMSYACRKMNLNVFITDIDPKALTRMKDLIYPKRYGSWDNKIKLISYNSLYKINKEFDLIIIGAPPESHFKIYKFCKKNLAYKKILTEKPIINFSNKQINSFKKIIKNDLSFCGYNHSISNSFNFFLKKISKETKLQKININWCESWRGILNAHFWLKNEFSSYLGDFKKGGGALQEHSHGLHLLIIIISKVLKSKLKNYNLQSKSLFKKNKNKKYDIFTSIIGYDQKTQITYNTDLNTYPAKKNITIYANNKIYEWHCGLKKNYDIVKIKSLNKVISIKKFKKTRSSEFENEIKHILNIKDKKQIQKSNLNTKYAFLLVDIIKKHFNNDK